MKQTLEITRAEKRGELEVRSGTAATDAQMRFPRTHALCMLRERLTCRRLADSQHLLASECELLGSGRDKDR